MRLARCLAAASIATLAACANVDADRAASNRDKLLLTSRDWINPRLNDVNAQLAIQRISDRLYSLRATLSAPLDQFGMHPLGIFMACISQKLAKTRGYDGHSFGVVDSNKSELGARELESVLGLLRAGETTLALGRPDLKWTQPAFDNAPILGNCEHILQPKELTP